jgi:tRNA pseudouridine13 synthase
MGNLHERHPYLTAEIPGTGGIIKGSAEDFVVDEIPSYEPCGFGEHLYLWIEKRGISTLEAIRRIAAALKIRERDVGYAGMKDAGGVTRQTFSLPKVRPEEALSLKIDGLKVVSAGRHSNKLKLGHLKGNRFRIVIRGTASQAIETVASVAEVLTRRGVPNYFGYQRYGAQGNSHLIGTAMLRRDWSSAVDHLMGRPEMLLDAGWRSAAGAYQQGELETSLRLLPRHCRTERDVLQRLVSRPGECEKAFAAVHPRLKKLYLSAVQSLLFDRVVEQRLERIDRVVAGDLAWKHSNGACFLVDDPAVENLRAESLEISPSGPMFGCRMMHPKGAVLELEQQLLAEEGLSETDFDLGGGLRMEGGRRPLRVPLGDMTFQPEEDGSLRLEFTLPKGSYATSVLREITKTY